MSHRLKEYKELMKQSWFSERINSIEKLLDKLNKRNTEINKIRNNRGCCNRYH
jgi:hypothetical protein